MRYYERKKFFLLLSLPLSSLCVFLSVINCPKRQISSFPPFSFSLTLSLSLFLSPTHSHTHTDINVGSCAPTLAHTHQYRRIFSFFEDLSDNNHFCLLVVLSLSLSLSLTHSLTRIHTLKLSLIVYPFSLSLFFSSGLVTISFDPSHLRIKRTCFSSLIVYRLMAAGWPSPPPPFCGAGYK